MTRPILVLSLVGVACALVSPRPTATLSTVRRGGPQSVVLSASPNGDDGLQELFGGFTAKQRLREEIDSPFRKVRLVFFGFSTISALIALYFSVIAAGKAYVGGFSDALPLDDSLQSVAVNFVSAAVCAAVTANDLKAGEASLKRIAQGGALAKLRVAKADNAAQQVALSSYRNARRVAIACGGEEFLATLAKQLVETEGLAEALARVDLVVVPVLLSGESAVDARGAWREAQAEASPEQRRSSDAVVALPVGVGAWTDYLAPELATATQQKFDPEQKGLGIYVKKNGRVLRRATGLPKWNELIDTMDVLDGTRFGSPR